MGIQDLVRRRLDSRTRGILEVARGIRDKLVRDSGLNASIHTLWDIGMMDLSVPARSLLDIMALLDPERIQKDLLVGDHGEESLLFLNSTEQAQFKRMIRNLSGRKLIGIREPERDCDEGSYNIHRVLQQKIQLDLDSCGNLDSVMAKATRLVRKRFPQAPRTRGPAPQKDKQLCRKYMPHVFGLLQAFTELKYTFPAMKNSKEMADLFYDAGFYIWDSNATEHEALALFDATETILNSEWVDTDTQHPRQADIYCISGLIRYSLGCQERNESFRRLKLALVIRKHVYDTMDPYDRDSHVLLENAATDYCTALLNRYEFGEADDILEQ